MWHKTLKPSQPAPTHYTHVFGWCLDLKGSVILCQEPSNETLVQTINEFRGDFVRSLDQQHHPVGGLGALDVDMIVA